ncbi:MAG: tetratricopeptide repeat protein [Candidatus Hodarchaeales archaeon]
MGKYNKAKLLLEEIGTILDLQEIDELYLELYLSKFLSEDGLNDEAEIKGFEVLQKSKEQSDLIFKIDSYLNLIQILWNSDKFEECRQFVKEALNYRKLSEESKKGEILHRKATLYYFMGKLCTESFQNNEVLEEGINYCKKAEKIYSDLNDQQGLAKTFREMGQLHRLLTQPKKSLKYLQDSLKISQSINNQFEIGLSYRQLGMYYFRQGEVDLTSKYGSKAVKILETLDDKRFLGQALLTEGYGYQNKGELDRALKSYELGLEVLEKINPKSVDFLLLSIGKIYVDKNQHDKALIYYKKSLDIRKEKGSVIWILQAYSHFIDLFLDLNKQEEIQEYYTYFNEIVSKDENLLKNPLLNAFNNYYQGLILKTSERIRDKFKAQEILLKVFEDPVYLFEITAKSAFNLVELLFLEYKASKDSKILKEINDVIEKLLNLAQSQKSFSVLAKTYLLKAQLSLLEKEKSESQRLLVKAQKIAEEKGLENLAKAISQEHDKLLEKLKTDDSDISNFESIISRLSADKMVQQADVQVEEPVILMILSESGLSIFSKDFKSVVDLNDQLIAGFLTAINAFGKEIFSGSEIIDRIMYKDFVVSLRALESLLFCYVFKGNSYYAIKKLEKFASQTKDQKKIWSSLLESTETGELIKESQTATLDTIISNIF